MIAAKAYAMDFVEKNNQICEISAVWSTVRDTVSIQFCQTSGDPTLRTRSVKLKHLCVVYNYSSINTNMPLSARSWHYDNTQLSVQSYVCASGFAHRGNNTIVQVPLKQPRRISLKYHVNLIGSNSKWAKQNRVHIVGKIPLNWTTALH